MDPPPPGHRSPRVDSSRALAPQTLTTGERQRLALAFALAGAPFAGCSVLAVSGPDWPLGALFGTLAALSGVGLVSVALEPVYRWWCKRPDVRWDLVARSAVALSVLVYTAAQRDWWFFGALILSVPAFLVVSLLISEGRGADAPRPGQRHRHPRLPRDVPPQ